MKIIKITTSFCCFTTVILLLSCFFIINVSSTFAQMPHDQVKPGDLGLIEGIGGFIPVLSDTGVGSTLEKVFTNLLGVFTVIAGLMFLIYFVLGAIGWITAEGDPEKVKKAQKQLTNAVVGLVLVVLAYSVAFVLGEVLGLDILNPAVEVEKLGPNYQPL